MKIEKKYTYSEINWILLPSLLDTFIISIPEKEFLEAKERRYEAGLRFEIYSFDKEIECHLADEFLQIINSLKQDKIKVRAVIECLRHTYTDFDTLVNSSPDYFQLQWSLNKCAITIEKNTFKNASIQIQKFEDTLLLKKLEPNKEEKKEVVVTNRKRTAFIAHAFDAVGESYAFNLTKFLNHLNFEISTGAGYSPDKVSNKVKRRLAEQEIVIAVVSEKLDNTWLVQETAGAEFSKKPLFLCIEEGVNFNAGILGDYEYIKFSKGNIAQAFIPILEGLRELGFSFK